MDFKKVLSSVGVETPKYGDLVHALWEAGHFSGIRAGADEDDIVLSGPAVNYYLLLSTLAVRLAAGDLELVEKGDTAGKKNYFDRLIAEIKSHREQG